MKFGTLYFCMPYGILTEKDFTQQYKEYTIKLSNKMNEMLNLVWKHMYKMLTSVANGSDVFYHLDIICLCDIIYTEHGNAQCFILID